MAVSGRGVQGRITILNRKKREFRGYSICAAIGRDGICNRRDGTSCRLGCPGNWRAGTGRKKAVILKGKSMSIYETERSARDTVSLKAVLQKPESQSQNLAC